jgi:hypothetical protein
MVIEITITIIKVIIIIMIMIKNRRKGPASQQSRGTPLALPPGFRVQG